MSRWILSVSLAMFLFALAACGPPPVDEGAEDGVEVTLAATVPATPSEPEPATATPEAAPALPTLTPLPEEYPAVSPPAALAPPTGYPVDMRISILRPLGNQCQEEDEYRYATLEEALADLEEAGIEVFASQMTSLMVCQGCDCPTSEHFQAEILRSDLYEAQTFGWYEGIGEQ